MGLEDLFNTVSLNALKKESEKLTELYKKREAGPLPPLDSDLKRLAYLSVRFPATYAVMKKVFEELGLRANVSACFSLLDVGAGPGTATLAAFDTAIPLKKALLIEQDPGFIKLAKKVLEDYPKEFICQDAQKISFPSSDIVVASYLINELTNKSAFVDKLWSATAQYLLIVEPGTPASFQCLKEMREHLIQKGAYLLAPCPHNKPCPLPSPDWCHFGARLERSSWHHKIKGGALNYEDEKYFYLLFSKNKYIPCGSRVLKRPFKGSGFVKIQFCSTHKIVTETATKKNKDRYSLFKKLEWGEGVEQ